MIAAVVLLLAVVVPRIIAAWVSDDFYFTRGDLNWDTMAVRLLDGEGLVIPRAGAMRVTMYAHRPPVFALILAGIYSTAGRAVVPVVAVQILFSILATFLLYRLAVRSTGSRLAAWLAALVSALYPVLVMQDVQIMETALFRGLVCLVTLQLLDLGRRPSIRGAAVLGLTAGLTVLTRTTLLPFLLLSAFWLLFMWGRRIPRLVPVAITGALLFLAALSPWLVRNAMLFGELHLITGSGRSIWIGSCEEVFEYYPKASIDVAEWRAWKAIPKEEQARLVSLSELDFDRAMKDRAVADLKLHPERIRPLALLKTGAAFSPFLNPTTTLDEMDHRFGKVKEILYSSTYGPLLLLGIPGLLLLLVRRRSAALLLLLHYAAFEVVTVIYWAHSRHRYYLDPFLAIAACALIVHTIRWFRARGAAPA